jgi:hypothetical protein
VTVDAPPRPPGPDEAEALIEEARERARRRRWWYGIAIVLALLAGGGLYAGFGGGGGGGSTVHGRPSSGGGGAGQPSSHAHGQSFTNAPRSQRFNLWGRCPPAPPNPYLPSDAGCVTVGRADVDGDGRRDLVLLYGRLGTNQRGIPFTLKVIPASGGTLATALPPSVNAKIAMVRDVNARRGAEIFVLDGESTSGKSVGVYTFDGRAVRRAGSFMFGGEPSIAFGFACRRGPPPSIVQHQFEQRTPFHGVWDHTDTTYQWAGAQLRRLAVHKSPHPISLSRRQMRMDC